MKEGNDHKQWREEIHAEVKFRLDLLNARQNGATLYALKERFHATYAFISRVLSKKTIHVFSRHAIELEAAAEYMGLNLSDFLVVAARFYMEHQREQLNGPATSTAKKAFRDVQVAELWELVEGTRTPQFEPDYER